MVRRHFFEAAGAMFGITGALTAAAPPALPDRKMLERNADQYWKRIREEQFLLPNWRAFLNNGSLGIAPKYVVKAVADYLATSAALDMDYYPRWGYETMDEFRQELADFYGCKKDELALMHNATEAMSTIAAGLDLKAGDEVLITDQEHPSGRGCWQMKAARHGVTLREVKIPLPPKSPEQLADLLISSIGPKTRVLSFSGIMTTTGLVMPVREICTAARAKGVITVVDGAHMHGQIDFRTSDLNCDYMAGSPHKWVFAPAGCGLLYVREENLEKLWPTVVSGSWNETKLKAARFMNVGTNSRAIMEGMMAGLRFYKQLGPESIRTRIHDLATYVRKRAAECPHVELLTPEDGRMFGSLVTVRFKNEELTKFHELLKKKRVWVFMNKQVRLAVHVHTRPQDIDLYFDLMKEALG
ncbi:MAG: aminotransferase class V-fold PLP-dependent enzyme [Bryobacterales bacterium]|nr:aminotransferase class V-fold PLP-dependent enzyme [Bryobacterales bacterium]